MIKLSFSKKNISVVVVITITLLLSYFPIFLHLERIVLREWDEARIAVSSVEMHQKNSFLITTVEEKTDTWNLKPPLLNWLQVLMIKTIGIRELSFRLPVAFSCYLICIAYLIISILYLRGSYVGLFSSLFLVTSPGFIGYHLSRCGDYDGVLSLFSFLTCILFFLLLADDEHSYFKKKRNWFFFFLFLNLSIFTKSVAILMFMPGLIFYSLWAKKFLSILKSPYLYLGLIMTIIVTASYYSYRESNFNGFLKLVWENELGGRFADVKEGHTGEWDFYLKSIIENKFSPFVYFIIPLLIIILFFEKDNKRKKLAAFSLIQATFFLIMISVSETKLPWYDMPLFAFLALFCGISLSTLLEYLNSYIKVKFKLLLNVTLLLVLLVCIFLKPYQSIIKSVYNTKENPQYLEKFILSYYLREYLNSNTEPDFNKVVYEDYHLPLLVYIYALNEKMYPINYSRIDALKPGDKVLVREGSDLNLIKKNFQVNTFFNSNGIQKVLLKEKIIL